MPSPVTVDAPPQDRQEEVLTEEALGFLAELHRRFTPRRDELLARRAERRAAIARNGRLDFLPETAAVREGDWRVAPAPPALQDRRVEITGPADRKMTVNALNSGARVWLADFEDASAPTWANVIGGQLAMADAFRRRIDFTDPSGSGKRYALRPDDELATVVMRPRGWHLDERHLTVDGRPVPGALVDFGLYLWRNGRLLTEQARGPYFYLAKLESHLEARLWNDVFLFAQEHLGLPRGTIRATVLIETITAAFEMDEILYELREHAAGLNAGRWDYLFSIVKTFRDAGPGFVLPDRNAVTMTAPFMRAYTDLLVRTCHRRGAHAIGGMAAFIPSRDAGVNALALEKVRADKDREAADGFDGSWVAHPALVPVARECFDAVLGDRPHQKDRLRQDVKVTADQLLAIDSLQARPTYEGLCNAIQVGTRYLQAWLGGRGAVAVFNLMEDVATAEISRSQIWQWLHAGVVFDDGRPVTHDLVRRAAADQLLAIREEIGEDAFVSGGWQRAFELLLSLALDEEYVDFLTLPAYGLLD